MKRFLKFAMCLLLALVVGGCAVSSGSSNEEPMTDEEIERFRNELYLNMTPGQRDYYESLPTRKERDDFLRQLGLLKTKERKR